MELSLGLLAAALDTLYVYTLMILLVLRGGGGDVEVFNGLI